MVNSIDELIYSRVSANSYDAKKKMENTEIEELVKIATHAPSAFNLQNWKFIAVKSEENKNKLLPLAYNQQKIVDSAVTFVICGTLNPHTTLAHSLKPSLDAGIIDQAVFEGWISAATNMYSDNPQFQRDEAIRSGTFVGMTLMLAAQGKGLVSCPMIGFDSKAVADLFALSEDEVPVMLITVGYPGEENWPQKPRKNISEVLKLV